MPPLCTGWRGSFYGDLQMYGKMGVQVRLVVALARCWVCRVQRSQPSCVASHNRHDWIKHHHLATAALSQFFTRTKTVTQSWKDADSKAIPGLAGVGASTPGGKH